MDRVKKKTDLGKKVLNKNDAKIKYLLPAQFIEAPLWLRW